MNGQETSPPHALWYWLTGAAPGRSADYAPPRPFASPYLAGVILGVVLFAAFFIVGRGLGASGPMTRLSAWLYQLVSPELVHSLRYYAEYLAGSRSVLLEYSVFSLLGTFVGAYTSAALGRRSRLTVEKGPRIGVSERLALAFVGGFIMAIGARIARGCTSGQVLTGSANLAIGSLIMFMCFFTGAYATAYVVRKQWI